MLLICTTHFKNELVCLFAFSNTGFAEAAAGGVLQKVVLKNFKIFTGKHLWWSLFFNKVTLTQVFSCEYSGIFKHLFGRTSDNSCCWICLTQLRPMFYFFNPWKLLATSRFLTFPGGIEIQH